MQSEEELLIQLENLQNLLEEYGTVQSTYKDFRDYLIKELNGKVNKKDFKLLNLMLDKQEIDLKKVQVDIKELKYEISELSDDIQKKKNYEYIVTIIFICFMLVMFATICVF